MGEKATEAIYFISLFLPLSSETLILGKKCFLITVNMQEFNLICGITTNIAVSFEIILIS